MDKAVFYDLMKSLPKAELHVHEEAVLRASTLKKVFLRGTGVQMSGEELSSLFAYTGLEGFLDSFIKIQSYFTKIDDLTLLFDDFGSYLEENNIVYAETFFSPTSHLKKGWDYDQMMALVQQGVDKIERTQGRVVKVLVDVSRSFGTQNAMHNLDLLLQAKTPCVTGIGLGGDEKKGPAREYKDVFCRAKGESLHTVLHAGETGGVDSIRDAIELCFAERIGHGIAAAWDDECLDYLARKRIPLEVCPTSNVFLLAQLKGDMRCHPIKKLYDAGCTVTLATDDPTFFKASLLDEYWNLYSVLGFSLSDIKCILENGFTASFMSESQKHTFLQKLDDTWHQWFSSRGIAIP